MSGFRLRALLEDSEFSLKIPNVPNTIKNDCKAKLANSSPDPTAASLISSNLWEDIDDDFNLEYMDLDEFLTETGLVDSAFLNIPQQQQQVVTQKSSSDALNDIAKVLLEPPVSSPVSSPDSMKDVVSVEAATQQVLPKDAKDDAAKDDESQISIVKKRRYDQDGEGLTDTTVVVVPGQDGFDPSSAKFTPEDLQPQPIIKKSKKQFVPEESKDDKYWRRRNKNNVAAKRSREARRAKENQIIMRASFLEAENERLTNENAVLLKKNEELQALVKELRKET